ncbi:MAG: hypothetical protein K0Q48_1517 [Bacillota bacterium]|jgi:hypothetical protein|nr:hypothetical protein [Bacillota bacterium]
MSEFKLGKIRLTNKTECTIGSDGGKNLMFNQHFGNYLLEKKILRPEELRTALEDQKTVRVKLGILAIDTGYMTAEQAERIHRLQAAKDRKFGELAIAEGYLTEEQVNELLNTQSLSNTLLGQVLLERGLFTFQQYEEVLLQYRQDTGLNAEEILALKNDDINKIAEIFLKTLSAERDRIAHEYFSLFIRNLIRFIDGEIRIETAEAKKEYLFPYLVTQPILGEYGFFGGFSADEAVLIRAASIYAEEPLDSMNLTAEDSLKEFLNCHNGLFLSHLSHNGVELDLMPAKLMRDGKLQPDDTVYVIPLHLSFGRVDFLFAERQPAFQECETHLISKCSSF